MERPNELRATVKSGNRDNALKNRIYPFEYICRFLLKCRDRLIKYEARETLAITDLAKRSAEMTKLLTAMRDDISEKRLLDSLDRMIAQQRETGDRIAQLEMDISEKNPIIEDMTNMLCQAEPIINRLVFKDSLTSAYNRYFFVCNIERLFETEMAGGTLNMAFIDIDGFRGIDAAYGHDVGDEVLFRVEELLNKSMRGFNNSYVMRMSGDEFILLNMELEYESFVFLMDAVRQDISQITLPVTEQGDFKTVTVSIACSNRERDKAEEYMQLYQIADSRMCRAKSGGKNRIVSE